MKITTLSISGLLLIEPDIYHDDRGLFFELFKASQATKQDGNSLNGIDFLQDNVSVSKKNVIRGLHFQIPPYEQGKLVTVIKGEALDVAVDIRKNSPTFGKHITCLLNDKNRNLFWIPPGFAHGFAALEENTVFLYKCSNVYHKASERGIRYDDPEIDIAWNVEYPIVSEKDLQLPRLKEYIAD